MMMKWWKMWKLNRRTNFRCFKNLTKSSKASNRILKKECSQENWRTSSKMMFNSINLWKKYWINRWKKSRWRIFSAVSMLYRNFFLKESKKKKKRWKSRIWKWKKWKCSRKSRFQNSFKNFTLSKFRRRLFL